MDDLLDVEGTEKKVVVERYEHYTLAQRAKILGLIRGTKTPPLCLTVYQLKFTTRFYL